MKLFMRGHKQDYITLLLGGLLVFIVFAIVIIISTQQNTPTPNTITPTPTSEPSATVSDNLPVFYDNSAEARLAQKVQARPTLQPQDAQAKSNTLNTILHGFNSGVLYETADVRIEYVESADLFMAEVKTTNVNTSISEASTWFIKQGLTQQGICNLPLMFYLDPGVAQDLQGQDVIFSPLPNGC